jgi:DNA polymerase-4
MDAFYAAVEQRDDPALCGKPVIVGGMPDSRGVVSTCSYEARAFGVRSAMPSSQAYRLCPQAVFVRPRFHAYTLVSRQIRRIFLRYTDCIEPLSLDEAFLDLSDARLTPLAQRFAAAQAGEDEHELSPAVRAAESIRRDIRRETGLTGSAGISYCKFLAKIASDMRKPDGLAVIRHAEARAFLDALPVERFFGVGKATASRLHALGVVTGRDLANFDPAALMRALGKQGTLLHDLAQGRDTRAVESEHERKSYGRETTFQRDRDDLPYLYSLLGDFVRELAAALEEDDMLAATVTVKVRYADFSTETRSESLPQAICDARVFTEKAEELLARTETGRPSRDSVKEVEGRPSRDSVKEVEGRRAVRLLGVSFSGLVRAGGVLQEDLPFG